MIQQQGGQGEAACCGQSPRLSDHQPPRRGMGGWA